MLHLQFWPTTIMSLNRCSPSVKSDSQDSCKWPLRPTASRNCTEPLPFRSDLTLSTPPFLTPHGSHFNTVGTCLFLRVICRASSTSPSNQSSKMNSMLYQKQFQPSSAGMRMTQHFPGQFNPQVRSFKQTPGLDLILYFYK